MPTPLLDPRIKIASDQHDVFLNSQMRDFDDLLIIRDSDFTPNDTPNNENNKQPEQENQDKTTNKKQNNLWLYVAIALIAILIIKK